MKVSPHTVPQYDHTHLSSPVAPQVLIGAPRSGVYTVYSVTIRIYNSVSSG